MKYNICVRCGAKYIKHQRHIAMCPWVRTQIEPLLSKQEVESNLITEVIPQQALKLGAKND